MQKKNLYLRRILKILNWFEGTQNITQIHPKKSEDLFSKLEPIEINTGPGNPVQFRLQNYFFTKIKI